MFRTLGAAVLLASVSWMGGLTEQKYISVGSCNTASRVLEMVKKISSLSSLSSMNHGIKIRKANVSVKVVKEFLN